MKVAVVGATGAVGRQIISDLEVLTVDIELHAFASPRSEGSTLTFRGNPIKVSAFSLEKLKGIKYVLMSAGGAFSKEHSQSIADQGSIVIDNSSAWRMNKDVPLVVPEVNAHVVKNFKQGIIANPNCTTIQMVVCLSALDKAFGLKKVLVSTYQSVSGSGQKGMNELHSQLTDLYRNQTTTSCSLYSKQIAMNVISAIDVLDDSGHCYEEEKMVRETRKILNIENLDVMATTARVPTMNCHCESVAVELKTEVDRESIFKAFKSSKGIRLVENDDYKDFPSCLEVKGSSEVFVSRIRLPLGHKKSTWMQFWNVADNLKKGAATNAVQIFQLFI